MSKTVLMQGNEACAEGAIAAGVRFFGGYPITPSTEVAETCALRLPQVGGKFIQMEDEIAGMAVTIGAAVTGVKAMTATSGPGFSLKQENIGYAAFAEIPCVIVNVQRSGPATGSPTMPSQGDVMQAKWGTHGDHPVIAISPSSVMECYELAIKAVNLSERYRTPVILLMDQIVGHMRQGVVLPDPGSIKLEERPVNDKLGHSQAYVISEGKLVPEMAAFGKGQHYNITGLFHDEKGYPSTNPEICEALMRRVIDKVELDKKNIIDWEEIDMDDAEIMVISYGGLAACAEAAVADAREKGIKAGLFRPITIWPFPEEKLYELSKKVKKIIVCELNGGQLLLEIERVVKGNCPIDFMGRLNGSVIEPDEIFARIEEVAKW